jgi:hypothetical protein
MDTAGDHNDDHVSVKKSGFTYVKVKVTGASDGSFLRFTSANDAIAAPEAPVNPGAEFLLKIDGKDVDRQSTTIQARLGSETAPVCASITADVYKENAFAEWTIYRVTDSASAGTGPLTNLTEADMQSYSRPIVKKGVISFSSIDIQDRDLRYDLNNNGALEWYYDGGTQTEFSVLSAGLPGDPKAAIVKSVNFAWRMSAAAAAGQNKIRLLGTSYLASWTACSFALGSGATQEIVSVASVSGNEVTLAGNLGHDHAAGEELIGTFGSGAGADPQVVEDGAAVKNACLHETLHRPNVGDLLDVNNIRNIMHYETGVTQRTELRFLPQTLYYQPGTENQWEKIPRQ